MKLLFENWNKFLKEEKEKINLSVSLDQRVAQEPEHVAQARAAGIDPAMAGLKPIKLFTGFRTDDDFWKYSGAFGGEINSANELDSAVESFYSDPEILYNDSAIARQIINGLSGAHSGIYDNEEIVIRYLTLWFLIWGYVGWDRQPQSDEQIDFIRNCYKNSGEPELKFYTGTAYRGLIVPESWLYEQLFMQDDEADSYMRGRYGDMRNKEALAGKNYLNLYRLIRGEKAIEPQTKSGFWRHYPRGRAESWSRKMKVASDYVMHGAFGQIQRFELFDEEPEEYLTIILVADGVNRNAEKFLDFDPLYKTTIASKETNNQEVPAFVKEDEGIYVKKAIIPYRQVKKLFDKAEEKLQDDFPEIVDAIKSGKLRPVQFENQRNSLMLKEHRYTELTKVEQDWELIF
jgi:hypothetical protein